MGWGRHPDATVRLVDAEVDGVALTTRLHVRTPDGDVRATLPVPGLHLAHNATAAIAIAHTLGVPVETMGPALARYAPEGMRNRVTLLGGHRVIDDAYNANPTSMDAALRLLASLPGPRVAVLGDMLELGAVEAESHREVLACAVSLGLDAVHVAGPRMTAAADAFPDVRAHADPEALADALLPSLAPSTAILVKGSRGARMERVTDRLRGAP